MQKFSRVVLTVAMLLGMLAMVPQAQATVYDPTNLNPPIKEGLVRLNEGGLGDALQGNFYRATVDANFGAASIDAANFLTYCSIENTSDDWVAAHVRLRSGRFSIEILDFPILLSPHDVFWFQFEVVPDALDPTKVKSVKIFSDDAKTCGYSDLPLVNGRWTADVSENILKRFTKLVDAGLATPDEMAIGHIEVFGLFAINAKNNDGVKLADVLGLNGGAKNFTDLMNLFYTQGYFQPNYENSASFKPKDCPNVLSGRVFSGDFTNGLYVGYTMNALANFRTDCTLVNHRDAFRGRPVVPGVIVYKPLKLGAPDDAYSDPDWATAFGPTWNDGDDWTKGGKKLTDSWSLDEVDDALAKQKISSTYFNSGFTGETFTLAVVTFPTKYLHVFFDKKSGIPETWATPEWPVGQPTLANQLRGRLDVEGYAGEVSIWGRIFDLEEKAPGNNESPISKPGLKSEVNVIPIGTASLDVLRAFSNLTFGDDSVFMVDPVTFYAGWFELRGFGMSQNGVDPREKKNGYDREKLPLLNCLMEKDFNYGSDRLIPASVLTMDWEFYKNIPHSRAFIPSFDNPNDCSLPTTKVDATAAEKPQPTWAYPDCSKVYPQP